MLLRRVSERIRSENWFAVVLDLFVVILGILLALQVGRFHQAWQDRRLEQRYLERLRTDLEADNTAITEIEVRIEHRLGQIQLLEAAAREPESVANHSSDFVRAIEQVTWRSFPIITGYTYKELQTSGRMALLRSQQLRRGLAEYYALVEETKRLGLGEDDQFRFRDETVGLLSATHLSAIEDTSNYALDVSAQEAITIAERFASRSAAHAWLTRLTKYQVLMRVRAFEFKSQARTLIAEISGDLGATR